MRKKDKQKTTQINTDEKRKKIRQENERKNKQKAAQINTEEKL